MNTKKNYQDAAYKRDLEARSALLAAFATEMLAKDWPRTSWEIARAFETATGIHFSHLSVPRALRAFGNKEKLVLASVMVGRTTMWKLDKNPDFMPHAPKFVTSHDIPPGDPFDE